MRGTPLSDDILKACRDFAREAFGKAIILERARGAHRERQGTS